MCLVSLSVCLLMNDSYFNVQKDVCKAASLLLDRDDLLRPLRRCCLPNVWACLPQVTEIVWPWLLILWNDRGWTDLLCPIKSSRITQFYQQRRRSQRLQGCSYEEDGVKVDAVFSLVFSLCWGVVVRLSPGVSHRSTLGPTRLLCACQDQGGCLTCSFSLERCRRKNTVLKTPGRFRKMCNSSSVWNEKRGKYNHFHNPLI